MQKALSVVLTLGAALGLAGCAHQIASTPAVMTYDGSSVDYSTIESMKHASVCKEVDSLDGNTTIIAAAKAAGISKVKHVDTSYEFTRFLFLHFGARHCVTVYGE